MNNINCSVSNCSHNKENVCYANIVNIGGKEAKSSDCTCCGSFLDKQNYSNLTNNTENSGGVCKSLTCSAHTCEHNSNNMCTANGITVDTSSNNAKIYTETKCSTFKLR